MSQALFKARLALAFQRALEQRTGTVLLCTAHGRRQAEIDRNMRARAVKWFSEAVSAGIVLQ